MISKFSRSKKPFLFVCFFFQAFFVTAEPVDQDIENLRQEVALLKSSLKDFNYKPEKKDKLTSFESNYNEITAKFSGKCNQEIFVAEYLEYLNKKLSNDSVVFVRTTVDYFMDFIYGSCSKPRLMFHDTLRFRYKWGTGSDVRVNDGTLTIVDTDFSVKGTQANKHLLWSRESWLKIGLGDLDSNYDNFIKLGIFPFSVGRGISLGAAYRRSGFLGFTPGFEVDQFAPGFMLHFDISPKVAFVESYIALLENLNTSFKNNCEKIRIKQIDECPERGTGRQSFLTAIRGFWNIVDNEFDKISVEPYIVYIHAPDQKLEFKADTDSHLTTFGCAVEGVSGSVDWGFEVAVNDGLSDIKAVDRNCISLVVDGDTACLKEQYTKVFTQDPAIVDKPTLADMTSAHKSIVSSSKKDRSENGKEVISGFDLFNAYDRFRAHQNRLFKGYFLIGDVAWKACDNLKIALGSGYASGDLNPQVNTNNLDQSELNNLRITGFVPLQSVYQGTRLRHLIIFNQGVPRFKERNPGAKFPKENPTLTASDESIEFTNIAFVGTRADWKIRSLSDYKVLIAPNLIFYWAPETPNTTTGELANNFMGTEFVVEASAVVYDKLKFYTYVGALLPGQYYKDMTGTVLDPKKPTATTGHDVAFLANIGMTYAF